MPLAQVRSYWSGGKLYFSDKADESAVVFNIDGPNQTVTFPTRLYA